MNTHMLAILLLLPVFAIPPGAADGSCDDLRPLPVCAGAGPFSESECESYRNETECYAAEGEYVAAGADAGFVHARAGAERAHVTDTFSAEAGACTKLDLVAEAEYASAGGRASALASHYTQGYAMHGNGTFVYEDPCGERLFPELEPGTYAFEVTLVGAWNRANLGVATVSVGTWVESFSFENDGGKTAFCERDAGVSLILSAIGAPAVVVDEHVSEDC